MKDKYRMLSIDANFVLLEYQSVKGLGRISTEKSPTGKYLALQKNRGTIDEELNSQNVRVTWERASSERTVRLYSGETRLKERLIG